MISVSKISAKQTLKIYLSEYRSVFKKRSFEIFYWLIMAILHAEEVRSIKFLYDHFIQKFTNKTLNSFYYFLSYAHFPIEALMITTLKIAVSLIPKELHNTTVFLSIDDTLQAKFGDKFDCYSKLFDHTARNGSTYLNGHCFVAIMMHIPLQFKGKVRYMSIPIAYKLRSLNANKLELAANLIDTVMSSLMDYQVILLCDSWYTKGKVLETVKQYTHLKLIGAVRSDTALFELPPTPTGKRGRPRLRGQRISAKDFTFHQAGEYFISTRKVMTRLFNDPVWITITTKNKEELSSIRMFICTINPEKIQILNKASVADIKYDPQNNSERPLCCYGIRWNIEVMFYQQKFFWSFGKYMVRNKDAIERYVNLLGIAYTFVSLLPFMKSEFISHQFQSPQTVRRVVAEQLTKELILDSFAQTLESSKIYSSVLSAVKSFLDKKDAA